MCTCPIRSCLLPCAFCIIGQHQSTVSCLDVSENLGIQGLRMCQVKEPKEGERDCDFKQVTGRQRSILEFSGLVCGLAQENLRSDAQQCCVKGPSGNRDEHRAHSWHLSFHARLQHYSRVFSAYQVHVECSMCPISPVCSARFSYPGTQMLSDIFYTTVLDISH